MLKILQDKVRNLLDQIDQTTMYYFLVPIGISLAIAGIYFGVLFNEFVLKDLNW